MFKQRLKGVTLTDQRVRMTSEVRMIPLPLPAGLNSILNIVAVAW